MPTADADRMVRLNEFAALCGVTRRTINFWIKKGVLPRPVKIGPRARGYHITWVRDFLASRPEAQP